MAYKNRFFRTLPNSQAQAMVAKAVAYTTDADFDTFVANAVEGEIGVFVAGTDAGQLVTAGSDLLAAGTNFYIAMKRDGFFEKSPVMKMGTAVIGKQDEVAAAKNKWTIGTSPAIATPAIGDVYEIIIADQTPGPLPYPTYHFAFTAKTATLGDTVDGLVTLINNNKNCPVTASNDTNTLVLEAKDYGTMFKPVLGLEFGTASIVQTTKMNIGSGTAAQVLLYERASDVFLGVTHMEDNHVTAQPSDFGLPTSFVDPAATYIAYNFLTENTEVSPTPVEKHFRQRQFVLFVPSSGTTPEAALNEIFGV